MNYLEAWNKGFDKGREVQLDVINSHCAMGFKTWTDVIMYIREVEFQRKMEVTND